MNRTILKVIIIIIILLAVVFGGIYYYQQKNNTIGGPVKKITIAMVTFPGYAPLYLAKEKGFFGDLDVELRRIESIGDIRAAMRSGAVDVYAATYDIFLSTKDVSPIGVGFLGLDESHGGDGLAVGGNISSVKDLKGKKVGAEPGFPPYLILQYLLDKESMTLKDLDFQDMTTTDAGNAFAAGQLAAAGIYEPALSASVKARPGAKVLASSADLPGLVQDLLFASDSLINEHTETLAKLATGWYQALDYIQTNPDEAYEIMAKAFDVSVQDMKDFQTGISWLGRDENRNMFNKNNQLNAYKTFEQVCNILVKNGEAAACPNPENILNSQVVNNAK
jgi:NitT/TauT family transport system substrate-binding protein